jgi:hypothetical protein
MSDAEILTLFEQHKNDPIGFAREIERQTLLNAWGLCNHYADLMKDTGHKEGYQAISSVGEELRKAIQQ